MVNGLAYLVMSVASGRLACKFLPVTSAGVRYDMVTAFKGRFSHADPRRYNNVQRFAYLLVILDIVLLVLSDLVLWKSVQFATLRELLDGYKIIRRTHFYAMADAVVLMVVHLVAVALVSCTLLTTLGGRVVGTSPPIQDRSSYDA